MAINFIIWLYKVSPLKDFFYSFTFRRESYFSRKELIIPYNNDDEGKEEEEEEEEKEDHFYSKSCSSEMSEFLSKLLFFLGKYRTSRVHWKPLLVQLRTGLTRFHKETVLFPLCPYFYERRYLAFDIFQEEEEEEETKFEFTKKKKKEKRKRDTRAKNKLLFVSPRRGIICCFLLKDEI